MIFSATVPKFIQKIAEESMEDPVMIDLVGDGENQLPDLLENKAIITNGFANAISHIQEYVTANRDKKILIFCESKDNVRHFDNLRFARFLPIHGDLAQPQRESALNKFRSCGSEYILVGTDVAARGLDVDNIDVVI